MACIRPRSGLGGRGHRAPWKINIDRISCSSILRTLSKYLVKLILSTPRTSGTSQIGGIALASRYGKLYDPGMQVIARKNLAAFWLVHPETEAPLRAWLAAANAADWQSMTDVVATYSKASPINAERCVFNIHGNSYRLIVAINFTKRIIFIKFISTHSEYDKVDAATVSVF